MLVTVTNATARSINVADYYIGYPGVPGVTSATGGNRTDPLPYPFGHIGTLLTSGTKQLPMHPRDWRMKMLASQPMEPGEEWQQLVQNGTVTLAVAAETGFRDQEETYIAAV